MPDIHLDLDFPDCWIDAYPGASLLELAVMNYERKAAEDFAADHSANREAWNDGQ